VDFFSAQYQQSPIPPGGSDRTHFTLQLGQDVRRLMLGVE
jgi:hypothetical protein